MSSLLYRDMVKKFNSLTHGRRMFEVFRDFTELFALSLRNVVDKREWQEREDRYLEVAKAYNRDQLETMAEVFAMVVQKMQVNPEDVLGRLYMELEIGNDARGQFFTPYEVAKLLAAMQADNIDNSSTDDYVSIYESACGAGAFMIATAQELRQRNREFHVTAEDIDPVAVHMAYIQFTLSDIPAVVYHRDTLSMETYDAWPTMAHVRGWWSYRLKRKPSDENLSAESTVQDELTEVEEELIEIEPDQGVFDFVLEGV